MDINYLISKAKEALNYSYSPYSKFRVGAALLTKDGDIYLGANIENSSYGLSMCAERNATFNAYCHGVKKNDIKALCIIGDTEKPISPCGACRQVLSELLPKDTIIVLANLNGNHKITSIDDLLPYSFTKDDLK